MVNNIKVIKRDGREVDFDTDKIFTAVRKAFASVGQTLPIKIIKELELMFNRISSTITVEEIQDSVERILMDSKYFKAAKAYIIYREKHRNIRKFSQAKEDFINKYKNSNNTADASVDDNSNVANKNIAVLNTELYKENNIELNRYRVTKKLQELYPDFDASQYVKDINSHIIYKNDENSTFGFPYCVAISMYPFLLNGIKDLGGLSAAPKNIDSFCGMFVNLVFAVSSQYAGAVATSEFLVCFDYFARKEWGNDYYRNFDRCISQHSSRVMTIQKQIHQYFQQITYSINQPSAARGFQSAFWNISIFDKPFFEGMFGDFRFPDGSEIPWESLCWLQKEFMKWFNNERLKTICTFPVVSVSLMYKDNEFKDKDMYNFVCDQYSKGDSFFTYISDSADSLASCCRLKNKVQTKEFNFTNGNLGVQTGSKSVITLNLNRIVQDWAKKYKESMDGMDSASLHTFYAPSSGFKPYLQNILERIYKYHTAYNELLWDMYDANLLPTYSAGFINLNKQYLTIGINGFSASAEFLSIDTEKPNEEYSKYCQLVFGTIKEENAKHKTKKTIFNTECIPAESCGIKLYNFDKEDGYWVPKDINLYTSYIFKPYSFNTTVLDKIVLHGKDYIGDFLDGGSACHINLEEHLSKAQYEKVLKFAADNGCQYFTFNVPNCECEDCGFIAKQPFSNCPKCKSSNVSLYDRIIGYLTKVKNWSEGRREEQKTRVYHGRHSIYTE